MSDEVAKGPKKEPTTYEKLAERFPAEDHKTRKQGGRDLTYLPGEKVIGRLNKVLGFDWSFRVVNQGTTDVEAWVLGELSATIDGSVVTRQQYGNQDLARGQHATTDLYKSAATDALKKAATTIGVGLYLYDEDERREVEAEMREAKRTPRPTAPPTPIRDAAVLTGASPAAEDRAANITKLQAVMRMALAEEIEFEERNPADLTDEQIQDYGKALADLVRAARKSKAS